jgi:hypothetical protein
MNKKQNISYFYFRMHQHLFCTLFILLLCLSKAFAQSTKYNPSRPNSFAINHQFDFSVGEKNFAVSANKRELIESKTWLHYSGFGTNKNFRLGLGARFSSYKAFDISYTTEKPNGVMHRIDLPVAQQNNLVCVITGAYRVLPCLELAYNCDVLGYATAYVRPCTYISNNTAISTNANANTFCFSVLGLYNYGMSRSEIYTAWYIANRLVLRCGYSFSKATYTTVQNKSNIIELQPGNSRYARHFYTPFIALAISTNRN